MKALVEALQALTIHVRVDLGGRRIIRIFVELDTLLGKEPVDDAKVRKQFKRLEKARTDLADERLGFVIRVREIIGAGRFQQLKTSYKNWR